jgi:hypothetical protein
MSSRLLCLAAAAGLVAAAFSDAALAAMPVPPLGAGADHIVQAYGGCGPYGHRGPYGGCRSGGQRGGYRFGRPCPRGFHLGPYGRRCWPN